MGETKSEAPLFDINVDKPFPPVAPFPTFIESSKLSLKIASAFGGAMAATAFATSFYDKFSLDLSVNKRLNNAIRSGFVFGRLVFISVLLGVRSYHRMRKYRVSLR